MDPWHSQLGPVAGAMLIFLNYEGFELIANAAKDVANPKCSLPIACAGGGLSGCLGGMILVSFGIVIAYRTITGREIHLVRNDARDGTNTTRL
jgi:amino acid transporter